MMNHQQLMRVYGALMWSLSKIIHNPEVTRIYVGSFWDQPLKNANNRELFEAEQDDLINDLQVSLYFMNCVRQILCSGIAKICHHEKVE